MGVYCEGLGLTIERVYLLTPKPLAQKDGWDIRDHRSRVLKLQSRKGLRGDIVFNLRKLGFVCTYISLRRCISGETGILLIQTLTVLLVKRAYCGFRRDRRRKHSKGSKISGRI